MTSNNQSRVSMLGQRQHIFLYPFLPPKGNNSGVYTVLLKFPKRKVFCVTRASIKEVGVAEARQQMFDRACACHLEHYGFWPVARTVAELQSGVTGVNWIKHKNRLDQPRFREHVL